MVSILINIIFSLLLIFLLHKGFEYIKHRFTDEQTQNLGFYQSKKYDELIQELQDIKQQDKLKEVSDKVKEVVSEDLADVSMENELSEFMNEL